MQGARHHLLAAARFPGQQHRDRRLRQPTDGAEHLVHGGRLAQDLGHLADRFLRAVVAQAFLDCAPDQRHRFVDVERLGQVLERAALEGRDRTVQVRERGHDDHGKRRVALLDGLQQPDSADSRHPDIGHQHLRCFRVQRSQHILGP